MTPRSLEKLSRNPGDLGTPADMCKLVAYTDGGAAFRLCEGAVVVLMCGNEAETSSIRPWCLAPSHVRKILVLRRQKLPAGVLELRRCSGVHLGWSLLTNAIRHVRIRTTENLKHPFSDGATCRRPRQADPVVHRETSSFSILYARSFPPSSETRRWLNRPSDEDGNSF